MSLLFLWPADTVTDVGGVASAEAIGAPTVAPQVIAAAVVGAEALGAPAVAPQVIAAAIVGAEALGAPAVAPRVVGAGIDSVEALGVPAIASRVVGVGVLTNEALGAPLVAPVVLGAGVVTSEGLGAPAFRAVIVAAGVSSAEQVGALIVGAPPAAQPASALKEAVFIDPYFLSFDQWQEAFASAYYDQFTMIEGETRWRYYAEALSVPNIDARLPIHDDAANWQDWAEELMIKLAG